MATKKKTTKTQKERTVSFSEFQAWLEGVEEMQPDDWAPSLEQWRRIRSKIDTVVTDESEEGTVVNNVVPRPAPKPAPRPRQPAPRPTTSALDESSALTPASHNSAGAGTAVKTPDIDSSGGYTTSLI